VKLLIATPVRGVGWSAPVSFGYSEYVRRLTKLYPVEEFPACIAFGGDLVRTRNRMAATILRETEATHVLWLDDDTWALDTGLVQRMIDTGCHLIGAPYVRKQEPVGWVHRPTGEPIQDDVLPCVGIGFGFTLTTRECLERMTRSPYEISYDDVPGPFRIANLFGHVYEARDDKRILLSEDFAFCSRWRALGCQVHIYAGPGNMVVHAGSKEWTARDIREAT
jgi:hypothetical protein